MIIYKCWLNTGKGNILSLEPNRARQISLCLALRNTNTNFWSHIMPKNDEISEPPGLKDITNLFPPSAPASPSLVANVSMKLPAFWPDAAEVWFAQCFCKQDQVLPSSRGPASRSCFSDLGPHLHSSSWGSLWSPQGAPDNAVHVEWLSTYWSSGLLTSLGWSEAFPSDEQDVSSSTNQTSSSNKVKSNLLFVGEPPLRNLGWISPGESCFLLCLSS